jgi:hypothetical protein
VSHLLDLVDLADKNKDGKIDFQEWEFMGEYDCFLQCFPISLDLIQCLVQEIKNIMPMTETHLMKVRFLSSCMRQ